MKNLGSIIGPSSTKRRIATVVAMIGTVLVAGQLARVWPRDVEVLYVLSPSMTAIEVDYLQDGEAVSSARFTAAAMKNHEIQHTVRLQPGEYEALITVYLQDRTGFEQSRRLIVPNEAITRFDLKEATNGSE